MGDVSAAIETYIDSTISLSQTDLSQAVKSREWFLKRIKKVILERAEGGAKEPVLYGEMVRFGSYFKGTKVKDVDEFDILVVIDSNMGRFSTGDTKIGEGQGVAKPNHKYDKKYFKSDQSGVSPAKMLNWLKGVVEEVVESYGGVAPERDGQAITATISSHDLKIDLVPGGIFVRVSDGTTFYNIPKGGKSNSWIETSPRADIDRLNSVAQGKDNFRNVVRIAKRIKDTYNFQVSSFAVETAIVNYAEELYWQDDLAADMVGALSYVAERFDTGKIPDPYSPKYNLISGVERLEWYAERLRKIVTTLMECEDIDDQDRIIALVMTVFENR